MKQLEIEEIMKNVRNGMRNVKNLHIEVDQVRNGFIRSIKLYDSNFIHIFYLIKFNILIYTIFSKKNDIF